MQRQMGNMFLKLGVLYNVRVPCITRWVTRQNTWKRKVKSWQQLRQLLAQSKCLLHYWLSWLHGYIYCSFVLNLWINNERKVSSVHNYDLLDPCHLMPTNTHSTLSCEVKLAVWNCILTAPLLNNSICPFHGHHIVTTFGWPRKLAFISYM